MSLRKIFERQLYYTKLPLISASLPSIRNGSVPFHRDKNLI